MKTKKILSLLIAMVMALGCVSLPAMAEESATVVAKVGNTEYTSVLAALQAAIDADASEVEILSDTREAMTKDFEIVIDNDLTITAAKAVKVEFYNNNTTYDFVVGSNNNNKLTIAENVHFDLVDRVIWLGYYGNNVDVQVDGYLGGYQIWHGADTTVSATGTLDSHGEAFIMRRDAILAVNGGNVNANYFQIYSGHIDAKDATITAGQFWVDNNYSYGVEGTVSVNLDNTDLDITYSAHVYAGEGKTVDINLTNGSTFDVNENMTVGTSVVVAADATSTVKAKNEVSVEKIPVAPELPNAEVSVLEPLTLKAGEYSIYNGSLSTGTEDLPLEIVMNFKANDTLEDCLAGGYSQWLVDFNLKFTGLTDGKITANNCYLAGNYGSFGWIVIPTDGTELEADVTYPVVSTYDATLNYKDICGSVQDFTAAIHVDQAILDANPNFKVELSLVMTNPNDADDKLTIGEPAVYTAEDLKNEKAVASIATKKYSSLTDAIAAAKAGDEITLLGDVYESVTIDEGKNIVLELAGFDIVGEMYAVKNNGTLTINDSVGTGNVYTTNVEAQGRPAVENRGTITINGGWFGDSNNDTADRNAINRGNAIKNYGVAVINGGHFTNVSNQYISNEAYAYAINTLSGGTTTINNAVIYGDINGLIYSEGKTIVNDGSFTLGRPNEENNLWYLAYGDVEIKGGTWTRAFKVPSWNTGNPTVYSDVKISGGSFNVDIADTYIVEGYEAVQLESGIWSIQEKAPVAKIGEKKYSSLDAAIEAANAGDTITLLDNIELENAIVIEKDKNITLDLAGKTISGTCESSQAYLFMVNNGADLTIKDSSTEQTGKITFAQGASNVGWIIDVEGDLVLESGTLELTGESWSIGYAVDVRPNAWGTPYTEETTFTMNGGKIVSSDGAVRVASSSYDKYTDVSASFTMNDGEIDADWDGVFVQQSNAAWDVLKVTINGGTIKSALNPIRFYGSAATSYVNGEDCVNIALNGGTLTYTGTDESLVWLVDDILRLGGGVTAEDFLKDTTVTASASFAASNVAEGYEWVKSNGTYTLGKAAEVEKIKLISTNATLDNSLAINFIYAKSDIVGTDYVAKIKHTTATGIEEKEIPYTDWVANGAYIYVPYEGISAKQMGDRVEITICKEDGTAVSETDFESLENYAINFFNYYETASNMDLWKKAIADMLNYGAAAQTYFGYNTDKLVNGTAAENVNTYASTEVKYAGEYKSYGEGAFATSLNLEDTIELIAIFQGVTDNMTAKVEFVNHNGKLISYDAELKKNGAYHEVIVDKLVVADINQPVRVTVYNADGSEYAWIEDSINEYLGYIQQTEYADPLFEMASKFATSAYAALHAND